MIPSLRNPPRNRGYFSHSARAFSIEKHNVSCSGYHSKIQQMLPRKVTLERHQILRLPRKVTLELHQILRLPRKVTLRHSILLYSTTLLYYSLLYCSLLDSLLFSHESIVRRIFSQTNLISFESILLRI